VEASNKKFNNLLLFFENEKKLLEELRNILTGETAPNQQRLNILIDECDYLWAHFPDYAGRQKPALDESSTAISFLKRVRTEIDPMLKIIDTSKTYLG
jgi:hypothetical protein